MHVTGRTNVAPAGRKLGRMLGIVLGVTLLIAPPPARARPGDLDVSFGAGGTGTLPSGTAYSVKVDRHDRIVVAGTLHGEDVIARFLPGGGIDEAVDPGEECDGGNIVPGDGCSATCRIEEDRDGDGLRDEPYDWCVNVGGS